MDDWSSSLDDDDLEPNDPWFDTETEVSCPYCGEPVIIGLDPGGGTVQDYVEDCSVCCQPWQVHVEYDDTGAATVSTEPA